MKIQTIQVDGFGIWSGLELAGIGEGLSVVFGPNEAGKTTLLELVRAVLYGFSASRRRYLPPQHGSPAGGWLVLDTPEGLFRVGRHLEGRDADAQERLRVVDAQGQACAPQMLDELLFAVDEQTFDHVFAVGLRELQYLGSLDESRAAALLYNLSIGLDGVNLPDVIAEVTQSRDQILDAAGGPCQLVRLLDQRQSLCDQLDKLGNATRRYERLAQELRRIDEQLARLESQQAQCRHQARLLDLAIGLRERWAQQRSIEEQLEAIGPVPQIPRRVAQRLDQVGSRLSAEQERLGGLDAERAELREQYRALPVNKPVRRRAEAVRALVDQRPRLVTLREQVAALRGEIDRLEEELRSRRRQLGLEPDGPSSVPHGAGQVLRDLRGPAALLRGAYQRWQEAAGAAAEAQQRVEQLARQVRETLGETESDDLQGRLERTSELVGRLRRRLQLDERLEQMAAHRGELEAQAHTLAQSQMLPGWILAGLGVVFVVGMVLILVGLLMPESITGSLGWALALLGLGGAGLAGLGKVLLERSAATRLEACQMQLRMLQSQMEQARNEREEIDRRLQAAGVVLSAAAIQTRLADAEQELATLEAAVPLQTRLASATQEAEAATRRADELKKDYARARRQWRQALAGAGLPERLSPRRLRAWLRRAERLEPMEHRAAMRREDLQQREQELHSLAERIGQLAAELQLQEEAPSAEAQLDRLARALEDEQTAAAQRRELRRKYRQLSRARSRCEEAIRRLTALRRRLLRTCGVRSEEQLRELAVRAARVEVLRKERDELDKAIHEAIGRPEDEPEVRRLLEERPSADELVAERERMRQELEGVEAQRARRYEQRGRLAEQMEALAADRTAAHKQLELSRIEQHIAQAAQRWQVLALGSRIFDDLKRHYQKHRQPETLLEASNYLARLTEGRYLRVWTPLDRDVLLVDTAEGESRPVETLSRGTREQLFLGLRLAVAACYARRGMPLPLVLDDVLVNFDARRAKAAAGVLRQFAQSGHQVLLFTCHEHLMKMFKSLKVPIATLPDSTSAPAGKVGFVFTARSSSKRSKARGSSGAKDTGEPSAAEAAGDESASDDAAGDTAAPLRPLKVDESSDVLPPPPPLPEGTTGDRSDDEPTVRNERVA